MCTITGKNGSITLDQAIQYHNSYGIHASSSIYQEYPKSKHEPMELYEKIEQLQEAEEED
jgi:hypothetical protein